MVGPKDITVFSDGTKILESDSFNRKDLHLIYNEEWEEAEDVKR